MGGGDAEERAKLAKKISEWEDDIQYIVAPQIKSIYQSSLKI